MAQFYNPPPDDWDGSKPPPPPAPPKAKNLADLDIEIRKMQPKPGDLFVLRHPYFDPDIREQVLKAILPIGEEFGCRILCIDDSMAAELVKCLGDSDGPDTQPER